MISLCAGYKQGFYLPKRNMNVVTDNSIMGVVYCFYLPKRNMNLLIRVNKLLAISRFYLPKRNMNYADDLMIIDIGIVFIFLRGI